MWTPGIGWVGPWRCPGSHAGRQGFCWCMENSNRDFSGREENESTCCKETEKQVEVNEMGGDLLREDIRLESLLV